MESLTKLACDLIAIPSVNPMGRTIDGPGIHEKELTDYLQSYFESHKVPFARQPVAPRRDNIIAWIPGTPGATTLLFEVHQDTVPADNMTIDPFRPEIENGRLFGRGACDVKGAMAAMLTALRRVASDRPEPRATVVLACTVDEEHQFTGVTAFLRANADSLAAPWPQPTCAVVAEPTELAIVVAHKGVVRWRISTEGEACHSSNPSLGINAIYRMAKVVSALERFAADLRSRTSHPLLGSASLSVGRIQGGVSVNTVPDQCFIEIDRRLNPGDRPECAHRDVVEFLESQSEIDFPVISHEPWLRSPALGSGSNKDLAGFVSRALGSSGVIPQLIGVPFGTDASKIAAAGIPSVVFGPGSIAQAHTADEWIELHQIETASEVYFRLVCLLGEPPSEGRKIG